MEEERERFDKKKREYNIRMVYLNDKDGKLLFDPIGGRVLDYPVAGKVYHGNKTMFVCVKMKTEFDSCRQLQ